MRNSEGHGTGVGAMSSPHPQRSGVPTSQQSDRTGDGTTHRDYALLAPWDLWPWCHVCEKPRATYGLPRRCVICDQPLDHEWTVDHVG